MRIQTTEVYRDWVNALKDRMLRARIQVRVTDWCMAIPANIVI